MREYKVKNASGQEFIIKGERPPNEEDLNNIFSSMPVTLEGKIEKNIDLTPSGIMHNISDSAASGLTAPFAALKNKTSIPLEYKKGKEELRGLRKKSAFSKVNDFLTDLAVYSKLPQANIANGFKGANAINNALTGAYQSAILFPLENLKHNGASLDTLNSIKDGAKFGAIAGAALPPIAKGAANAGKYAFKTLLESGSRMPISFAKQAIKPNSNALNMSFSDAQNLLTKTTSRLQQNYKELLNKRGAEVRSQAEKLKDLSFRIPAEDLNKSIDDIYSSYSLGGNVNYAENLAGDLKKQLHGLIEQGKPVTKINTDLLPEYTGDKKLYNHQIKELYKNNVQGNSIIHPEIGKVDFYGDGYKKTVGSVGDNIEQLSLSPQIDEILKNSKYQYSEPSYKLRSDKITDFDILRGKADINQNPIDVEIKVGKDTNGKKYFLHRSPQALTGISHGKLGDNNIITDNEVFFNSLAPKDLYDVTKQIGKMTNWKDSSNKVQNSILERLYGDYTGRLNSLSPELAQANKGYSFLKNFQKNEGLRRILYPPENNSIDTASTALRNYNSTITKGNTNQNIHELERLMTNEGYEPFLNDIDDINAVEELNRMYTTGDNWANALVRDLGVKPALHLGQFLNKNAGLSEIFNALSKAAPRYSMPAFLETSAKMYNIK